jgi:hypothetical protein
MNDNEWQIEFAKRPQMVYLQITSWRGMSFGAIHWYGEMCTYDYSKRVKMSYELNSRQAVALTKLHNDGRLLGADYVYHECDEVDNYDTKDQIIKQACATWRKLFPGKNVLVLGDPVVCEPPLKLDGEYK